MMSYWGKVMKYKIGQTVKVKNGVFCPDDSEFNLSGWTGRIIELVENEEPTVCIEFDSITLKNMPEKFVKKSEQEGLDWSNIYLDVREVEPTKSRDTEQDAKNIRNEINKRFEWIGIGSEGELIQSVINSAESFKEWDALKAWKKYLEKDLQFPFETFIHENWGRGPLNEGDILKVFRIELVDDHYGIIVACRKERKRYDFPLVDLKLTEEKSINADIIEAYRTWFANRH
jgi:hypothetical protein